jgi:hypothetical protein
VNADQRPEHAYVYVKAAALILQIDQDSSHARGRQMLGKHFDTRPRRRQSGAGFEFGESEWNAARRDAGPMIGGFDVACRQRTRGGDDFRVKIIAAMKRLWRRQMCAGYGISL